MHTRGRSTHVSPIAIARRASLDQRTSSRPPSPTVSANSPSHEQHWHCPDDSDNDDLHPPPSIDDHVCLTNIHLYTVQLTDNDLQDDVWDHSLDDAVAAQHKQRERCQAQLRIDRLRACERIWDDEKRRLRRERLLLFRAREHALLRERQRQREERDRMAELERMRHQHRLRTASSTRPRGLVSYTSLPLLRTPSSSSDAYVDEPFQYDFMIPSSSRAPTTPRKPRPKSPSSPQLVCHSSNTVQFKDVLASMHGPLFPPDSAHTKTAHTELLDSLLESVQRDYTDKEKPSQLERTLGHRSIRRDAVRCAACSASTAKANSVSTTLSISPSSSGARSAPSRSGSWLSFGSRTAPSTAPTTPSTSPIYSWLKRSSYFAPAEATTPPHNEIKAFQYRHSCHSRLTRIDISATPLGLGVPIRRIQSRQNPLLQHDRDQDRQQGPDRDANNIEARRKSLVFDVAGSMSCFLGFAKGVHVTTTIVSISFDPQLLSPLSSPLPPKGTQISIITAAEHRSSSANLKPPGWRVPRAAAAIFASDESEKEPGPPPHFIPLLTTRDKHRYTLCLSPSCSLSGTDTNFPVLRTALPNPPPPVFPPPPPLPRSPLRPRDPPPAGSIVLRVRPVANPALLRLRALQNVLDERGVGWEGKAKEGGLGAGRERLCRVAFEGLGRSALAWEIRQCVV